MNGKLPFDYLLSIIAENTARFQKEVIIAIIPGLDLEAKQEIMEVLEEKVNG